MIVTIGSNYRMRRYDGRNWTIDELRTPDPENYFVKQYAKSLDPKWHNLGVYFQKLDGGLRWCYEHELLKDSDLETDLKGAIDEAQRIADSLTSIIQVTQGEIDTVIESNET